MSINENEYQVAVGLSDGKVVLFDQTLNKQITKFEVSKIAINSIQFDPIDHYLYIGDERGFLHTYDLLKKKIIKSQELHAGAVAINGFYDPSCTPNSALKIHHLYDSY